MECSDGRAPYWGNKSCWRFKPKRFDLANTDAAVDASTDETYVDVVVTGFIFCLEAVPITLDVMVQKCADVSFQWQEWKVMFLLFPKITLSTNEYISVCGFKRFWDEDMI